LVLEVFMSFPTPRVRSLPAIGILFALLIVIVSACSEDEQVPLADHEVRIRQLDFLPDSLGIVAGQTVRWVNTMSQSAANTRTVTSGEGPDDSEAGSLFDATLGGYSSGHAYGDYFVFKFVDPGRYPYFTRLPTGEEYTGVVVVY